MSTFYFDKDADLALLAGRTVAIVGYGNQGRSQALNLKDNGINVIVGNIEDDFAATARADGWEPGGFGPGLPARRRGVRWWRGPL